MTSPPDAEELLRHTGFVHAVANALLRDDHHADDITQETFFAALVRRPRGPGISAWLRRVARNLSLNVVRTERRRRSRERAAARPEALPSTGEAVERLDTHRRVVEAVRALAEPYRSTVIYRFFYELKVADIADRLGAPQETVRTRLRRALGMLRTMLEDDRGEGRVGLLLALAPLAREATVAGGLAMGLKAKMVLVAILLIALLATFWYYRQREPGLDRTAAPVSVSPTEDRTPESEAPRAPVPIDRELDVHGEVVEATGVPVAGARVAALYFPGRRTWVWPSPERAGPTTQTDEEGRFRLRLGRNDLVDLRVSATGFAPQQRTMIQAGEWLRVVLMPPVRVIVNVEGPSGGPVSEASVRLSRAWRRGGVAFDHEGKTDAQGQCVFAEMSATPRAQLTAWHPEHGGRFETIAIPAAGSETVTVRLRGGRTVTGTVRDAVSGAPIAGATLSAGLLTQTQSDEDGRFTLDLMLTNRIEAEADGYAPVRHPVGDNAAVDIEMSAGFLITGQLVDPQNAPVAAAPLTIFSFHPGFPEQKFAVMANGTSGADGTFRMKVEGPERVHILAIFAPGYGRMVLDFEAREDRDLGRITLPPSRTIAGRVLDADGQPVPRVKIEARGANRDRGRLRDGRRLAGAAGFYYGAIDTRYTDDLGRFRFPDLSPGVYTLWVEPKDRRFHDENHELPEDRDLLDVEIRLKGAKSFKVTVVDRHNQPVAGLHISLETHAGRVRGRTGADGVALLTVEKAVTRVSVTTWVGETPKYLPPRPRDVRPHEKEVRLVLEEAGVATGKLVGPNGTPLRKRAKIETRRGDDVLTTTVVAADGTFRAAVPAVGAVDLVLTGQLWGGRTNIAAEQFFFTGVLHGVTAGMKDLILRAQAVTLDRSVRVQVLTPEGESVERVYIQVYPTKTEKGYTTLQTDQDGRVEFRDLPSRAVAIRYADARRHGQLGFSPPSPQEQRIVPQGQQVTFTLRAAVPVRGIVTLPNGTPAAGVALFARVRSEPVSVSNYTDKDGRFEILVPPDSAGELVIQGSTHRRDDKGVRRYSGYVRVHRLEEEVKIRLELRR